MTPCDDSADHRFWSFSTFLNLQGTAGASRVRDAGSWLSLNIFTLPLMPSLWFLIINQENKSSPSQVLGTFPIESGWGDGSNFILLYGTFCRFIFNSVFSMSYLYSLVRTFTLPIPPLIIIKHSNTKLHNTHQDNDQHNLWPPSWLTLS